MPRHPADIAAFGDRRVPYVENQRADVLRELKERMADDDESTDWLDELDTATLIRILDELEDDD